MGGESVAHQVQLRDFSVEPPEQAVLRPVADGRNHRVARQLRAAELSVDDGGAAVPDLKQRVFGDDPDFGLPEQVDEHDAVHVRHGAARFHDVVQHLDDGDGPAGLGEPQRRLAPDEAPADDNDPPARFLHAVEHVGSGVDVGPVDAGHVQGNVFRAGRDHDGVRLFPADGFLGHFRVHADIDRQLLDLAPVPFQKAPVVVFEFGLGTGNHVPAQLAALFIQGDPVPAQRGDPRGLHARDAPAGHQNLLGLPRGFDFIIALPPDRRVDRAAEGLALERPAEASLVAADARPDVIVAALHRLFRPFRVGEQGPAEADHICGAVLQRLLGHLRNIQLAGDDDRDFDGFLQLFGIRQIKAVLHIDRRMRPVPGVVGADVGVELVVAGRFEDLRGLEALFQAAALVLVFLAGQAALPPVLDGALHAVAQADGEILPHGPFDNPDDLARQRQPALQVAAVLIRPAVEDGKRELVEQVPLVHRVDFHAVESGRLGDLGRFGEFFHDGLHFRGGQRAAGDGGVPVIRDGRGGNGLLGHQDGRAAPAEAHRKLQEDFRPVCVDALGHLRRRLYKLDGVDGCARKRGHHGAVDFVFHLGDAGDQQAGPAPGPFDVIIDRPLVVGAVVVAQAESAHRGHGNLVLDFHLSDFNRLKKFVPAHLFSSFFHIVSVPGTDRLIGCDIWKYLDYRSCMVLLYGKGRKGSTGRSTEKKPESLCRISLDLFSLMI